MKADKDEASKNLVAYEKRYEPMERIIEAAKAKVKETERSLGDVVSVQLCFNTVLCLKSI
jgi:hypothetical protein